MEDGVEEGDTKVRESEPLLEDVREVFGEEARRKKVLTVYENRRSRSWRSRLFGRKKMHRGQSIIFMKDM